MQLTAVAAGSDGGRAPHSSAHHDLRSLVNGRSLQERRIMDRAPDCQELTRTRLLGYPGPGPQPGNPGVISVQIAPDRPNRPGCGRYGRIGRSGCCQECCQESVSCGSPLARAHGPEAEPLERCRMLASCQVTSSITGAGASCGYRSSLSRTGHVLCTGAPVHFPGAARPVDLCSVKRTGEPDGGDVRGIG